MNGSSPGGPMKMKLAVFALALALMPASALWAQDKKVEPAESQELNKQAYAQLLRMDLKAQKEAIIRETMQLDPQQAAAFWPIYRQYDGEQTKLWDQKVAIVENYAANFLTMTNEKADELAQQVMQLDEKRMALREKYYAIVKKALSPILAARFFQVENQIQLIVDLQIASNLPIIEAPDNQ
jgi:hypothetical protein